jgi:lysophospholipase L1-like esterase
VESLFIIFTGKDMIDCLILGDSIAVGVAMFKKECISLSKGGINSQQYNKKYAGVELYSEAVLISLGSNDHKWVKTKQELLKLRHNVNAKRVYWVLPEGNLPAGGKDIEDVRKNVLEVSDEYGDIVLPIMSLSKDGIHPTVKGYKNLAEEFK